MAPVFECKWLSMLWLTSFIKSVIDLSGLKISTSAILPFDDDNVCSSNKKSEKLLKWYSSPLSAISLNPRLGCSRVYFTVHSSLLYPH